MTKTAMLRATSLVGLALAAGLACQSQSQPPPIESSQKLLSSFEPKSGPGSGRGKGDGTGDRRGVAPVPQSKYTTFKPLSPGVLGADRIPGYRHLFNTSKFKMGPTGQTPNVMNNGVYTRYTGPEGAYLEWPNGFAGGVPNANAPATQAEPYSTDDAAHTTLVLTYFKDRGIPQNQLAPPSISTQIQALSHTSDGKEIERKLIGYTTILHRTVDGFPVPESHAWARFNRNLEVVSEQVWWPELPGDLLVAANAFRAKLADPSAAVEYKAKLPVTLRDKAGTVTIHHATPVGEFWHAEVSYDIQDKFDIKNFDINGNQLRIVSWNTPTSGTKQR